MKSTILTMLFTGIIHLFLFASNEKNIVPSVLQSAIVYRNGAELSHKAKATLQQGNNELIIDDVSNNVDAASIQVHCNESVTIMSVEFSTEYLKPEIKSSFLKKLEDSLSLVEKETGKIDIQIKADNESLELLKANKEIRGTQIGLSVAELTKMVDYYKQKTLELQIEIAGYKEKQANLLVQSEKLENAIKEEENKNAKTTGKIILQLLSAVAGTFDFTVSYLTPTAYWNPTYDIKVNKISDPVKLMYKAKLVQTSGIDWHKVKLTLSTAVPSKSNNAPLLRTWFLHYINPVAEMENKFRSNTIPSVSTSLQGMVPGLQLNEVVAVGYAKNSMYKAEEYDKKIEPLYIVNNKPMTRGEFGRLDQRVIKNITPMAKDNAIALYGTSAEDGVMIVTLKDDLSDYVSVNDNQLNITFDIDIPYDISSNGKENQIALKEYTVPALFKFYSAPKLDNDVYLLGEINQWEKLNLIPGEASIIFENTYVGKTFINPASTEDTINLTLGKDKRIVVKREKISDYSSVKFLGNNKEQIFTYEITVKNNKSEEALVILKDQYPITSTKEIESKLLESNDATINEDTGVLTWKLKLAPGESKKVRIKYSIKYQKDKTVNLN
jgi:hypothetical protein